MTAAAGQDVSLELVMEAGANVAVCRLRSARADGGDGDDEFDWCVLVGVDADGLIDRWHVRPIRDLRLALADAAEAHPEADALALFIVGNRHDREGMRRALHPDFELTESRDNGLMGGLRRDEWVEAQNLLIERFPAAAVRWDVLERHGTWLLLRVERWDDPTLPPSWQLFAVVEVIDGLWRRMESFDDLGAARERLAQSTGADGAPGAADAAS